MFVGTGCSNFRARSFLIELCGRVAEEQEPAKLLELIDELSRVSGVEEERAKAHDPKAALPSL
jgi:hypothetical protein